MHDLFQRTDLLVTGDRIMQSAGNMLTIARAGGCFLGPVDRTPYLRAVVSRSPLLVVTHTPRQVFAAWEGPP